MRFAINLPNFGPYGDPKLLADLAHEAEEVPAGMASSSG